MRTSARRLGAVALTAALVSGSALVAPAAQAAPNSYAYSGGTWLSDQLTNGVVHNDQYDFDDYGLSLDVFFALDKLDTRPASRGVRPGRAGPGPGGVHRRLRLRERRRHRQAHDGRGDSGPGCRRASEARTSSS